MNVGFPRGGQVLKKADVRRKNNFKLFLRAYSVLKKADVRRKNNFKFVRNEKTIMASVDCPFVVC
ncbi:hypothetical protein T484DRAFT_1865858 [Baffinella frigidus]|nr:hypothetical protein T484DRAFT_1865858 [Cryptophyta sp. CCMP2293]